MIVIITTCFRCCLILCNGTGDYKQLFIAPCDLVIIQLCTQKDHKSEGFGLVKIPTMSKLLKKRDYA